MSGIERTVDWIKGSACGGGECVQAAWTKSSRSLPNGACVQVRLDGGEIWLRDSKDPDGPVLKFIGPEWEAFLAGIKNGEFDIPRKD
jgi:Domain of unknown function (DUF397)